MDYETFDMSLLNGPISGERYPGWWAEMTWRYDKTCTYDQVRSAAYYAKVYDYGNETYLPTCLYLTINFY